MLRYVLEPGLSQLPVGQGGDSNSLQQQQLCEDDPEAVLEAFRATTIGTHEEFQTPFGSRRVVYTDYTASGRASSVVEDFVREKILPVYGNTHTLTTATARQTTYFRAEAREVVRHHLNATHEDAVIFAGNGSTGAAHLLVQTLQRSAFNVGAARSGHTGVSAEGENLRDMFYREDRWGGGECTLCGVRVKSANIYQAHKHSETHRAKLREQEGATGRATGSAAPRRRRVVVLLDGVCHHSSSLPFRELVAQYPLSGPAALAGFSEGASRGAGHGSADCCTSSGRCSTSEVELEVSTVPVDVASGLMDESELRRRLEVLRGWRGETAAAVGGGDRPGASAGDSELVVLCILAAASNVTGLCADVPRLTGLVRGTLPGAVVCWDFAAALGHQSCNLNPPGDAAAAVDAAFFSPHKLWAGPGSSGILAVKKRLLCNATPAVPGGGVVFYVSDEGHTYIQNSEEREEAGTPNILGCIRAGLAFHLLDQLPTHYIPSCEAKMLERTLAAWVGHPRIDILGPVHSATAGRTGIISFMIRYGNAKPGLYLHYNFVVALLNDLFGVQARGGCACAGPYAQWLLGMSSQLSRDMEACLKETAQEVLRPGFVRIGVHWAMSARDLDVLIEAVKWVAEHGWKLLAAYTFDRETGEWLHRLDTPERRRVWLSNVRVGPRATAPPSALVRLEGELGLGTARSAPKTAEELLTAADAALREAYSSAQVALSQAKWPVLHVQGAPLLWFALPADVAFTLKSAQPGKPQLIQSDKVFTSGSVARPEYSVLDARQGRAAELRPETEVQEEEVWAPLDAMLPEDMLGTEEVSPSSGKPSFSRNQLRPSIPKPLRGLVGKAISDFNMVEDGDRLLVGLSGGKDSLTVLHILLALRRSAPINFEIVAATVDPETPEFNPWPLVPYLEALGVKHHMLSKPIIEMAKVHMDPKRPSLCAFCSRMKRGMLYSCMRENNYNVLVLGQHLDDFAESFFMSAIHNGLLRTMKANYLVQQEDVRVCRPLLYVRESQASVFAKENRLPIIADNCPACFAAPKERHKTKILLSSLEFDYPQLFSTLLRTMRPLYALETADRGNGILAGAEEDDARAGEANQGADDVHGRRAQVKSGSSKARAGAAVRATRDVCQEDADAELVLSACGPSAAADPSGGDSCLPPMQPQDWQAPVAAAAPPAVADGSGAAKRRRSLRSEQGLGALPAFALGAGSALLLLAACQRLAARGSAR